MRAKNRGNPNSATTMGTAKHFLFFCFTALNLLCAVGIEQVQICEKKNHGTGGHTSTNLFVFPAK